MRSSRSLIVLLSCAVITISTEPGAAQQKHRESVTDVVPVPATLPADRDVEVPRIRRMRERKRAIEALENQLEPTQTTTSMDASDSDLILVGPNIWYRNAYGSTYYFMGEVRNTGASIPTFIKINIDFLSSSGAVLASDWTYVYGSNRTLTDIDQETDTCLSPGETGFFGMYTDVDINLVDSFRYSIEASYYSTAKPDANIIVSNGPYGSDSLGTVKLTGNLKNTGSDAATFVKVYAALKDSSGALLDVDFTYVDGSEIGGTDAGLWPGHSGPFTMYTEAPTSYYRTVETKTGWDDAHLTSCTYTISPSQASFGSAGGTGSISVSSASNCSWTASSEATFVHITSGSSGSGNGTVTYSVDNNTSPNARTGTLRVAGKTFTISQAGGNTCAYSISPTSASFGRQGGTGKISVSTSPGCTWKAQSNSPYFIHVTSGSTGTGSGVVEYQVDANNESTDRSGALAVAGKTFTVIQSAEGSYRYLVPGVIHAPGANGTQWRSDLTILNAGNVPAEIELTFRYSSQAVQRALVLQPGHTTGWHDVVPSFFDVGGSASGAVDIHTNAEVIVTARNYNESGASTYGQYLPGVPASEALPAGATGLLPQLRSTADFRTNIGLICFGDVPCPVTIQLKDPTGNPIGSPLSATISPGEWRQLNRVFESAGSGHIDLAYAEIRSSEGAVWAYGSIVDNTSGDGTTVLLARAP